MPQLKANFLFPYFTVVEVYLPFYYLMIADVCILVLEFFIFRPCVCQNVWIVYLFGWMGKKSHVQAIIKMVHSAQNTLCRLQKFKTWFLRSLLTSMQFFDDQWSLLYFSALVVKWTKLFKNGPSKIFRSHTPSNL